MGIDREDKLGHPEPAGDDADAAPARTLLDYIDELGGPVVIVLLILIVGFLLL